jgi:hypothetical protein
MLLAENLKPVSCAGFKSESEKLFSIAFELISGRLKRCVATDDYSLERFRVLCISCLASF